MKIGKLLLIDDDEINNFLVSTILEDHRLVEQFHAENSGVNALAYLAACPAASFPDVIIVDLKMPVMDGFEFIERYEAQFYPAFPQTQLVVLSSSIRELDKQQALSSPSVRSYITKPLDTEKLRLMTTTLFHKTKP